MTDVSSHCAPLPGARRATASRLTALLVLASAALIACGPKQPVPQGRVSAKRQRAEDEARVRALQLATFDHAWQRIADTYPHEDFRGLDWEAVKVELRPRAARCHDAAALRPVLQEMLGRLGESHFQVMPSEALAPAAPAAASMAGAALAPAEDASMEGDIGLEIRRIGGEFVTWRVLEDGPTDAAGIGEGWTLHAIDSVLASDILHRTPLEGSSPMAQYVGWAVLSSSMRGRPGTPVRVQAIEPDGTRRSFEVIRRDPPGEAMRLGHLQGLVSDFEARMLPGDVGYLRFSMFLTSISVPFTDAMRDFIARDARGVIIDLRGNPGGIGGLVTGLGGHFLREPASLGAMKTRQTDLNFVANPRGPGLVFDAPVAILVDGLSLSTSELFAAGMQQLGRARVFGERTGGMALPSIIEGLPNGDRMQFAIADLLAPGGRRLEGVGVHPDEEIPLRKSDLLSGRDAPLDAALRWLDAQRTGSASGDPPG